MIDVLRTKPLLVLESPMLLRSIARKRRNRRVRSREDSADEPSDAASYERATVRAPRDVHYRLAYFWPTNLRDERTRGREHSNVDEAERSVSATERDVMRAVRVVHAYVNRVRNWFHCIKVALKTHARATSARRDPFDCERRAKRPCPNRGPTRSGASRRSCRRSVRVSDEK